MNETLPDLTIKEAARRLEVSDRTWCPLVDRWLDHAEDRGARIPAVVRRAIAGACNE